jgi:hypothetical protein
LTARPDARRLAVELPPSNDLEIVGLVATLPVCALAARGVARFHASVRVPATLVIVACWLIRDVELRRLVANIDVRFVPYLVVHFVVLFEWLCGLLIGGMLLPVGKMAGWKDARSLGC